jgi:hypothetical protein
LGVPVGIVVVVVVVVVVEVPVELAVLEVPLLGVVVVGAPAVAVDPRLALIADATLLVAPWTSWLNGLRADPLSLPPLGAEELLTTGRPAGAADWLAAGAWATCGGLDEPFESSTGAATSAASSKTASGHSRFSLRSPRMRSTKLMA